MADSSPQITLTTPTPSLQVYPTLSSPLLPPETADYYGYTGTAVSTAQAKEQGEGDFRMNDYTVDSPDGGVGLDMEVLHDFGAGVGVDMRDFGHTKEEMLGGTVADTPDHELSTPQQLQAPITPHQPSSMSNGMSEPPTVNVDDMFQTETGMDGDDDDDDDDDTAPKKRSKHNDVPGGFTFVDKDGESGRRKIRIEYITDKSRRHITFSKRKAGIMKKAYELSILTGTQVLLLVVSETGLVYTFTTTKLQPLVQKSEGKNLIQACLNAPDGYGPDGQPLSGPVPATKAKNGGLAIRPHKLTAAASAAMAASAQAAAASTDPAGPLSTPNDQQLSAAEAIGQGTPVSARPKKRMPSGKAKKGSSSMTDTPSQDIPPVPPLPDIHRQPSPHMGGMTLQSPISASYPYPPQHHPGDYGHPHHPHQHHHLSSAGPSPTQPTFGYPPGEYAYYPPPPPPHGHPGGYLGLGGGGLASPYGHTGHPGQGHSPGGQHRDGNDRRMMGMGM